MSLTGRVWTLFILQAGQTLSCRGNCCDLFSSSLSDFRVLWHSQRTSTDPEGIEVSRLLARPSLLANGALLSECESSARSCGTPGPGAPRRAGPHSGCEDSGCGKEGSLLGSRSREGVGVYRKRLAAGRFAPSPRMMCPPQGNDQLAPRFRRSISTLSQGSKHSLR